MIPIAKPLIGKEEEQAILEVIASGQLAMGPKVREFEQRFAAHFGAAHAVATSSGTTALHAALLAHGIGPGDEVITTPFSFIASASCALFVGARPVFADIEPDFYTLDPAKIEACITPKTRAIIPVHLFGQPCDMDAILAIAQKHHLIVIEDAAQAHGAVYKERCVGSCGTACYSLYATKNITTIEGGMILTSDPQIAEQARLIRSHGSSRPYEHTILGYNMMTTDLAAAIGCVQLDHLDAWNGIRQANAAYLTSQLSSIQGVTTPAIRAHCEHVFHQYTIRISYGVAHRDEAVNKLREKGIGAGVYYPIPIHKQPLFRQLGYIDCLPNAEAASQEVLSLPVHPSVTRQDLDYMIESIAGLSL